MNHLLIKRLSPIHHLLIKRLSPIHHLLNPLAQSKVLPLQVPQLLTLISIPRILCIIRETFKLQDYLFIITRIGIREVRGHDIMLYKINFLLSFSIFEHVLNNIRYI